MFELKGELFLLVVDYYSRYVEVAKLTNTTSPSVIVYLKSMFAKHGIPDYLVSDNGPQFAANPFAKFTEEYRFTHVTTSPRYPQANGEVERSVQTVKSLLKKSEDQYKALMAYRSTLLESGLSPAELLMGRRLRTTIPTIPSNLQPSWPYLEKLKEKDAELKARQKDNFDRRHKARNLPPIQPGDPLWLPEEKVVGRVLDKADTPRSYVVETPKRVIRRNQGHLNPLPRPSTKTTSEPSPVKAQTPSSSPPVGQPITTRSGREVRPPERYQDFEQV